MKRSRGRPVWWTPEILEAAHEMVRRYGAKRAAAMFGITYNTFVHALHRHKASVKTLRRAA